MIAADADKSPRIKNSDAADLKIVRRLAPIACMIAVSLVR